MGLEVDHGGCEIMFRRVRRRLGWLEVDLVASIRGGKTFVEGGRLVSMRSRVFRIRHFGGGEKRRHFGESIVDDMTPSRESAGGWWETVLWLTTG
ncbi:hypothetical protein LIER_44048 [Lithospermum erythrorhizon]|uniref:Uncharacterized protein n=1 Tax=Lithospermum erythrorhizon TaxID=34254 RepID=A0AAV3NMC9_LITER